MRKQDLMSDDDWLFQRDFNCPSCNAALCEAEHSPFEDGYYLYCTDCPKRVDLSVYDARYTPMENQFHAENPNLSEEDDQYLDEFLQHVARFLEKCDCGGVFVHDAPRRCIECGLAFPEIDRSHNVWFADFGESDPTDEKHSEIVVEPKWKPETPSSE